jgi:hypothetical protein
MSCQKCGSTDTYCGCDEATAIAERDAALAKLAALRKEVERLRNALAEIWDNTKEFEIRVLAGNALNSAEVPE